MEHIRMSRVQFGQGGVPDWLEPSVRFCSRCGAELKFGTVAGESRQRLACPACGFICYVNPRLVVGVLPVTEMGEVMLIRRSTEPGLGMWAQPGGFLEIDETLHEAAVRETLEETGLVVEPGPIVGLYQRIAAAMVVIVFEARIVGGTPSVTHESLETRPFAPEAIPWEEIAFETSIRAIRDWVMKISAGPAGTRP